MLKSYRFKTHNLGDSHSSKTLKLQISFCQDSW